MFQIKQKSAREQKMFIKASVAQYGIEWHCVALYGLVRPFLPYMESYGLTLSYMAFYGLLW